MTSDRKSCYSELWFLSLIFLLVAGYVLVAGVLVQRVIAPAVTDGTTPDGFIPELDSGGFHEMAVAMSEDIRAHGWEKWELNPGWSANQPVGIMAAVYVITGASPIYLLPLNALIHGLSVVLLFLILRRCGFVGKECFVGVFPFAFFPSTLVWVAQFHKDGIYCLGFFSLILGSLLILDKSQWCLRFCGVLLVLTGGAAVSIVRDYSILVYFVAAGVSGLLSQIVFTLRFPLRWRESLLGLLVLCVTLLLLLPLAGEKGSEGKGEALEKNVPIEEVVVERKSEEPILEEADDYSPPATPWVRSTWLPGFVDERVHQLIHNRTIFIWLFPDATSYVDKEKIFQSSSDVVLYIPKAISIGLLAPFPNQWYDPDTSLTGNLQRMVSGVEMILSYILLVSALGFIILRPSRPFFFLAVTAILMILALVYPLPAVGSLYRIRFGPYSILLAIGAASLARYVFLFRMRRG